MIAAEVDMQYGEVEVAGCACALCCAAASQEQTAPQEQTAQATSQYVDGSLGDEDQNIDALLTGEKWATTSLTYSFPDSALDFSYDFYGEASNGFSPLNTQQIAAAEASLGYFADVSGLTFTRLDGAADRNADLTFAESSAPGTAWAYFPSSGDWGGDSWFNRTSYNSPETGDYAFSTFMHEAGHALGLKHGHETSNGGALNYEQDSHEYSIMTYRSYVGSPASSYSNGTWSGPQTPMMFDIAAIQRMYGANFGHENGDTTYTFSTETGRMFVDGVGALAPGGNVIFRTIWDGNGVDTYNFSNFGNSISVDLAPGGYVDLDVGGNDQRAYLGGQSYARGHIFNALQYNGDERSLIENAIGGSGADEIAGNNADNLLEGRFGSDTLAGFAGDDTLKGGGGADLFQLSQGNDAQNDYDVIADSSFSQGDRIRIDIDGMDRIVLGSFADVISIDALANVSVSQATSGGTLVRYGDGAFSASVELASLEFADIEAGFAGTVPDGATDNGGGGAEEPPEVIVATPVFGGGGDDALTGGELDDTISGGAGDDTILGLDGADEILGGGGNDSLAGGNGADVIAGGAGQDTVLGGGGDDRLSGGFGNDVIGGGGGADIITGGLGADRLSGWTGDDLLKGGAGSDVLFGHSGADTLHGQDFDDVVHGNAGDDVITGGEGRDLLTGGLDNDRLAGGDASDSVYGGVGDDVVSGQGGNDWLFGGSGADVIVGGAGTDVLSGGAGADEFRFFGVTGGDRIRDFQNGVDVLNIASVDDFSDVRIFNNSGDAMIWFNGGSVRLENTAVSALDADDFIF